MTTELIRQVECCPGRPIPGWKERTGAALDERWTKLMGRKVWRNLSTGETWVEEK